MKEWHREQIVCMIIFALMFVFACEKKPENAASEQGFVNPIAQYGESMVTVYKKGKQAGVTGNLDAVKKTIEAYHAMHDRYPESLDEIEHMFGSPIDLSIYDYDPDTGEVALKK